MVLLLFPLDDGDDDAYVGFFIVLVLFVLMLVGFMEVVCFCCVDFDCVDVMCWRWVPFCMMTGIVILTSTLNLSKVRGKEKLAIFQSLWETHGLHKNVARLPYGKVSSDGSKAVQAAKDFILDQADWQVPCDSKAKIRDMRGLEVEMTRSFQEIDRYIEHVQKVQGTTQTKKVAQKKTWCNQRGYLCESLKRNDVAECVAAPCAHVAYCAQNPPSTVGMEDLRGYERSMQSEEPSLDELEEVLVLRFGEGGDKHWYCQLERLQSELKDTLAAKHRANTNVLMESAAAAEADPDSETAPVCISAIAGQSRFSWEGSQESSSFRGWYDTGYQHTLMFTQPSGQCDMSFDVSIVQLTKTYY